MHQEDLCQALGVPPTRKYQNEGGPGVREVTKLLRDVMPPDVADAAVWRFADALIWNWLIAGTDAHAKNYSLLLAGDRSAWRLSTTSPRRCHTAPTSESFGSL